MGYTFLVAFAGVFSGCFVALIVLMILSIEWNKNMKVRNDCSFEEYAEASISHRELTDTEKSDLKVKDVDSQ